MLVELLLIIGLGLKPLQVGWKTKDTEFCIISLMQMKILDPKI